MGNEWFLSLCPVLNLGPDSALTLPTFFKRACKSRTPFLVSDPFGCTPRAGFAPVCSSVDLPRPRPRHSLREQAWIQSLLGSIRVSS